MLQLRENICRDRADDGHDTNPAQLRSVPTPAIEPAIDTTFQNVAFDDFTWMTVDAIPDRLNETYALRYNSYCLEKRFLDAADYPAKIESDPFDANAIHLAVMHKKLDQMRATARLVPMGRNPDGGNALPAFQYCDIANHVDWLIATGAEVAEISRVVMSRAAFARLDGATDQKDDAIERGNPNERDRASRQGHSLAAILTLYKGIYQTCRRTGVSHLVAAMERSFWRLARRFHFPFHQIGPEVDYFGPVVPFMLNLDELDHALFEHAPRILAEFFRGLELWALPTAGQVEDRSVARRIVEFFASSQASGGARRTA